MKKVFFAAALLFGFALLASVAHDRVGKNFLRAKVSGSYRQFSWRGHGRLGSLCGAVSGQTHSRKSRYRGTKHARRGTIIAANHIYNVAKPDGLSLGVVNPANYIDQLLGSKEVKFDWPKFSWIGSPERLDYVLFMRTDIPYKTLEDIRNATEPPRCGALADFRAIYSQGCLRRGSGLSSTWCLVMAEAAK